MLKKIKIRLFPSSIIAALFIASIALTWGKEAIASSLNSQILTSLEIAQETQGDVLLNELNQSMVSAVKELPSFLAGLQQFQNPQQTPAQVIAQIQELIPKAESISENFAQAQQVAAKINSMLPPSSQEAMAIKDIVNLNQEGAVVFGQWNSLLTQMLQAIQTQNNNALQNVTNQQLPNLGNRTANFLQSLQAFAKAASGGNSQSSESGQ